MMFPVSSLDSWSYTTCMCLQTVLWIAESMHDREQLLYMYMQLQQLGLQLQAPST